MPDRSDSAFRAFLTRAYRDAVAGLRRIAEARQPTRRLFLAFVAGTACWFLYVPLHELLHVAGCVTLGGTVSTLELAPQYGGTILARFLDFVEPGGEFAGRLTGFDHADSDLVYLGTCLAPYLLTVFPGVVLLRAASRTPRPAAYGCGVVVGLAPFTNLIGDFFEIGAIVSTRVANWIVEPDLGEQILVLRTDDPLGLLRSMFGEGTAAQAAVEVGAPLTTTLFASSLFVGLLLALLIYSLGSMLAERLCRETGPIDQ